MTTSTSNLTYRPFQKDDIDAFIDMIKAIRRADGEPDLVNREEVAHQIHNPLIDFERDTEVALDEGRMIGMGFAAMLPTGQAFGQETIHPDYEDEALRVHFISMGEDRIRARFDEIPEDKPIYIMRGAMDKHTDRLDLYTAHGYKEIRRFYEMKIDFDDDAIAAPDLPEGIEFRPFDKDQHAEAAWQAHQESFRDHFGYVEDTPFEQWQHRNLDRPGFDGSLWLIAWDGDEIAGVAFNSVDTGEEATGYVGILAVRRAWRKRGLGGALLRHSFRKFQERGFKHVNLGVDASSKTNAVALYENAGMYVNKCMVQTRKVLRGDEADIVD